eukprot:CAMPEP_0195570572 /NCGR_PEP_ID=MMETSP0814-20130614/3539_1 /TAXON_ID=97485 /ORGANISM="Prymnesium parvum, Strain Texoma1" /LENGTH=84 /DNA_ID=CAMNT_0040706079 /DNA_START=234 /DNA_END=488 /DNA_ORIENTATION=-
MRAGHNFTTSSSSHRLRSRGQPLPSKDFLSIAAPHISQCAKKPVIPKHVLPKVTVEVPVVVVVKRGGGLPRPRGSRLDAGVVLN